MSPLLTGRLARLKEKLPLSGHQTPEDKLIPADAEFSSELQEAEQLTVAKKNFSTGKVPCDCRKRRVQWAAWDCRR